MEKPISYDLHGNFNVSKEQVKYLEMVTVGMICVGIKSLLIEQKPVLGTELIDFDIHVK